MDSEDRERLVRVEEGVKHMKKKIDSLCTLHDDVQSLKQTQKNLRRGVWVTITGLITASLTYFMKGSI